MREIIPGAIFAPIVWELVQHVGVGLAGYVLRHLSNTHGRFTLALGALASLQLPVLTTLCGVELNVVSARELRAPAWCE